MESAEELFGEILQAGLLLENNWMAKQSDRLDIRTRHIYRCRTLRDLHRASEAESLTDDEQEYAIHRWRNYKRHEAWLSLLLEQVPTMWLPSYAFHKSHDFFIQPNGENIAFDLKVTRYPHSAGADLGDGALADWFYLNQSREGRYHLANRFFVVGQPETALYDIDLARETISNFVTTPTRFRHFVRCQDGGLKRAVILRQVTKS